MRVVALVGRTKPQRIQLSRMNSSCENAQIWAPGLSSRLRWPIPTSFTESENHSAQMLRSQPDRVPQNLGFASTPDPSKRFGSDPESIGFGAERGRVWGETKRNRAKGARERTALEGSDSKETLLGSDRRGLDGPRLPSPMTSPSGRLEGRQEADQY